MQFKKTEEGYAPAFPDVPDTIGHTDTVHGFLRAVENNLCRHAVKGESVRITVKVRCTDHGALVVTSGADDTMATLELELKNMGSQQHIISFENEAEG